MENEEPATHKAEDHAFTSRLYVEELAKHDDLVDTTVDEMRDAILAAGGWPNWKRHPLPSTVIENLRKGGTHEYQDAEAEQPPA